MIKLYKGKSPELTITGTKFKMTPICKD